jgi:hypothetical protein
MIFRLSQKLSAKIKTEALPTLPLDENPLVDWSAHLFVTGRTQYILLSNTKSLYSTLMPGKGIADDGEFIDRALGSIRAFLQRDGQEAVYERFIAPASDPVRFARALNRSVTGSITDLTKQAAYLLAAGDASLSEVASRLNETPMSALKHYGSSYGFPRDVFRALANQH